MKSLARLTLAAAVAGGLLVVGAPAQAEDGMELVAVKESLLAKHYWYEQTFAGHPVLGGFYAKHVSKATGQETVDDGRIAVSGLPRGFAASPAVGSSKAGLAAQHRTGGPAYKSRLVVVPGAQAKLAWQVSTEPETGGSVSTLVDAGTGQVLSSTPLVKHATGTGKVFDPSPLVTQQNPNLKDTDPLSAFQYKTVTLNRMTASSKLVGDFANNTSKKPVTSTSGTYAFDRSQAGFEQVMGYYHITTTQEYIQSLGFTGVNNESQDYRTTGLTADNSYYDPARDQITFGTGGVDDAEDAEIIWHEYGHAIHDAQVPGFGTTNESGAIGEGFGDYWAYTMSQAVSPNTSVTPWACVGDWDAVSYTSSTPHCLRRTDGNKVYPGDIAGEVHDDGEIWSRALMDINIALGRTNANKVILEAQFGFAPGTTFSAAATKTVATAQTMFGSTAATQVKAAFQARGIL
ncbi:M4 family metallopeptidase [Longispora albida]|uniref:M4 family metallopeptidase n=1 Tax=Longispora albida TaxID=203523 RepID=UPI0003777493|nr:M4 family metallopeptidase [Longispora albida]